MHMPSDSLAAALRLVSPLSDTALHLLFSGSLQKSIPRGEILLAEGQVCSYIYVIERGCMRSYYNREGIEINNGFSFEYSFVTNLKSLRTGAPSEFCIQAAEQCVVRSFGKEELKALYTQSPEIESFGRKLLEKMLVEQEEQATFFRLYSPAERYEYLVKHQPHLLQRVSLSQLASYLGMSRETLSRIRKKRL
jgi:CRP-like cAMP-binding protein